MKRSNGNNIWHVFIPLPYIINRIDIDVIKINIRERVGNVMIKNIMMHDGLKT